MTRHHLAPLATVVLLATVGCNSRVLATFLDLPAPPAPVAPAVSAGTTEARGASRDTIRRDATGASTTAAGDGATNAPALPPPPFESTLNADSARAMLPRDRPGNVDWVAAVRQGIIRPRAALPGRILPDSNGFRFLFDFFFPGPDTTFDAFFPHSTHTEWVNCQQCHARIFPYRGATIRMSDVLQGKYCAECHGKVAYPVATACERCHVRFTAMPPNRTKGELIGTLQLARATRDSVKGIEGNAGAVVTDDFPRATFPHWVHRSRYRCKACHMELFEPRSGANRITMQDISAGKACGACHNGRVAFAAQFGSCERCHIPPKAPVAAPVAAPTAADSTAPRDSVARVKATRPDSLSPRDTVARRDTVDARGRAPLTAFPHR
ncbi:MAG TPA: c(7)-type cytochrome triheme domain-containing protein [Gemmatimonadaceae bacterium]|nr:c(7)-type cytochrome triheme domain-containing protein [Gemmatimonadaceae bacterium]